VREKAIENASGDFAGAIVASDRDDGVVRLAQENAMRAGVLDNIEFNVKTISTLEVPVKSGFVITNPPYGIRVGERTPLRNLYAQLGNVLRRSAVGYTILLLSADKTLERMVQIPFTEILRTRNGGIPVRLLKGEAEPKPL
jgi:23S rRNA G2445 N2-methylase RlmL